MDSYEVREEEGGTYWEILSSGKLVTTVADEAAARAWIDSRVSNGASAEQELPSRAPCRECGAAVTWARRAADSKYNAGGWHPPLDYAGTGLTVLNGVVLRLPLYQRHVCLASDIEAHRQAQLQRKAERRQSPEYLARQSEAEQHRQIWIEETLPFGCPKCQVTIGQPCVNLSTKDRRPVKNPHDERKALAAQAKPELRALIGAPA